MSRGGAAHRRTGDDPPSSSRVTAAPTAAHAPRRANWVAIVLVALVLVGLVGGYFVTLVVGSDAPATSTSTP